MTQQIPFGLGCRPSPPDRRDFPAAAFLPAAVGDLPAEYRLPWVGDVESQGSTSMCVDFSVVAMKQAQEWAERGTRHRYGHGYIYGLREATDYQGEGMYPREALAALLRRGVPPADLFDVTGTYEACRAAAAARAPQVDEQARPQRVTSYVRCYAPEQVMGAVYHLHSPVMVGVVITNMFMWLTRADGIVHDEPADHFEEGSPYDLGGHAMIIVGWRRIGERLYYVVQNSWGTGWGDAGFCYLPSDYPGIYELWAVTDARPRGRFVRLPINVNSMELHWPEASGTDRVVTRTVDVGATLLNGRTVLPVRHVSDALTELMAGMTAPPERILPLPNVDAYGNVMSVDLVIPEGV